MVAVDDNDMMNIMMIFIVIVIFTGFLIQKFAPQYAMFTTTLCVVMSKYLTTHPYFLNALLT